MLALFVAQSAFAQMVSGEDPIGTVYTYETKVGDFNLVLEQTLLNIDGDRFTFKSKQELPQGMGTLEIENSYIVKDGKLIEPIADRKQQLEEQMAKMGAGAKVSIEGDLGFTPLDGKLGDEFEQGSYTTVITVMGMSQNLETKVLSCKIINEESLTTPAGTFDTIVLETVGETVVSVMGQTQTLKTNTKSWIVRGKGIVKSIIDDGSGNVTTQILKSIVKP